MQHDFDRGGAGTNVLIEVGISASPSPVRRMMDAATNRCRRHDPSGWAVTSSTASPFIGPS
jgi:hypothetical protein